MRHRASRPLIDLWRRLPGATARLVGGVARPGPVRGLVAVMVVLSLGTGAYAVVASVMGGPSNQHVESAAPGQWLDPTASRDSEPPVSRAGERPSLNEELPTSDSRTPNGSSSDPGTAATEPSEAPSPADVTATLRSTLGPVIGSTLGPVTDPVTGSPSTPAKPSTSPVKPSPTPSTSASQPSGTPSATASQPGATASATAADRTPPDTNLSEEYPAGDAARFSFSADEAASFTCSLDGAAYTPCDSPTSLRDLHPGWHTFAVRATDAAGNVDPSPAEVRWRATGGNSTNQ